MESILTFHCKSSANGRKYTSNNGWIDLLLPLITLKLPRSDLYNLFEAIYLTYIPRHVDSFHLLRLLLLYHDPQLCNFLDTKKVTPDLFAMSWVRKIIIIFFLNPVLKLFHSSRLFTNIGWLQFQALFAASCDLTVVLSIWDLYFQKGDPFFVFYLALVILVNDR